MFPQLEEVFVDLFKLHGRQSALLSKQDPSLISKAMSGRATADDDDQHALFGLGTDMVSKSSFGATNTEDEDAPVFR
jgi:hypothetical protein